MKKKNNYLKKTICFVFTLFALTGCSASSLVQEVIKNVEKDVPIVDGHIDQIENVVNKKDHGSVKFNDGIWIASKAQKIQNGERLPSILEYEGITISRVAPMNLLEIGAEITKITGIPVKFDSETLQKIKQDQVTSKNRDPFSSSVNDTGVMVLNFRGSLSEFLGNIASKFDISWEYTSGRINFKKLITRSFTLSALPTVIGVNNSLDSGTTGAGGGGSTSSSSQTMTMSFIVGIWNEIETSLASIIGSSSGRFIVSPSTGNITVSAPASVMKTIEEYLNNQESILTRQVAVSVKVLNVNITDADSYGFDPSVLLQPINDNPLWNFSYGGTASAITGAGRFTWGILDPKVGSTGDSLVRRDAAGVVTDTSNAVFETLRSKGDVSVKTSASVTTINNIPAPVQVSTTTSYVRSVSSSLDETGTRTSSVNPDSVTTGFSMHVLPKIMDGRKIMMQFGMSISELIKLETFTAGTTGTGGSTSSVQLPETESRSFNQQVIVNSGSTLILTGYEKIENKASKSGNFDPDIFILGGKHEGDKKRNVTVILITPVILDTNDLEK